MARTFSTPGVYRREIDLSDILVPAGISNGGIVIRSFKGPINRPVLITNDKDYIDTFGAPYFVSGSSLTNKLVPEFGYGAYAALEFLKESTSLYVVRDFTSTTDKYASVGVHATAVSGIPQNGIATATVTNPDKADKIQNIDDVTMITSAHGALLVAATYPGTDGNSIAVTVESFSTSADWKYNYDSYPTDISATYTSATVANVLSWYPIASKVFKLNVYTKDTSVDWTSYYSSPSDSSGTGKLRISPVETFYASLIPLQDADNKNLYAPIVINGNSKYIYVKTDGTTTNFTALTASSQLPNGDDGNPYVQYTKLLQLAGGAIDKDDGLGSDSVDAWNLFTNREDVNVNILINPDPDTTVKQTVANIAAKRMDCIAVSQVGNVSVNTFQNVIESEQYGYVGPSYHALYAGYSKVYDQYNDKYVFLPNAIYGAQLMARVDNIADPWTAPAGIDRGTLSVIDQNKVFSFDDIGKMYDKNINAVRLIRGVGFTMWGQKTAQLKKSALDRINVRRNLLYIENNIETALLPFCFENNNVKTRLRIFSVVDGFLSTVQAGGGLTGYKVVCDETNNTSEVIDSNQLNVDIYVQPTRTAEFIQLTTVITRSGINLSEVRI